MQSLLTILIGLTSSWYFTDLSSDSFLQSIVAPIGIFIFLISFLLWLVIKGGMGGKANSGDTGGGSFDGGCGD
jgi:hypothetical protein